MDAAVIVDAIPAPLNPDYDTLKPVVERQINLFRDRWRDVVRYDRRSGGQIRGCRLHSKVISD
ncbi:hypothetical protein [Magnetospirillum gryphiswaldense]|nr:hypothetical protein [Magnetospirillum gryphiswaldense]